MKKLIILTLIIAGGIYYYYNYSADKSSDDYSITEVDSRPIPRDIFFQQLSQKALDMCNNAETKWNTTEQNCKAIVQNRTKECENTISNEVPDKIDKGIRAKNLASTYLKCAAPYPFCGGREIRTDQEAMQYCTEDERRKYYN